MTEDGRAGPVDDAVARRLGEQLRAVRHESSEPEVAAARAVGETLRAVIDRLTATSAPPAVLAQVEERLADAVARLAPYDAVRRYEGVAEASGVGHDRAFFDWSPQLGLANPLAPPINVTVEDGIVVGRASYGMAYEGPPGCVHGGCIAAAFDEVLGLAQSLSGRAGMTGTLSVKYRRPTPLLAELRFEGRVDQVSGRKVLTSGKLLAGGQLTAEATGLFVTITPEYFRAHSSRRDRSSR